MPVNMNESGHSLLPPIPQDRSLRPELDQQQEEEEEHDGNVGSRLLEVPASEGNPPESALSRASTEVTACQPEQTADKAKPPVQRVAEKSKGNSGKTRPSILENFRKWQWKFEIALLLLSICSLVAIIVVLAVEDGTPLESWKFYFSLNTIISILGTVSRSSLASAVGSCLAQEKWNWFRKRQDHLYIFDRIDHASRGSLGSFQLLFWMKF